MAEELIPAPSGTRLRLRTGEKGGVPTFLQLEVIGWTLKQSSDGRSVLVPMVWGYGSEKTGQADRLDDVVAHLAPIVEAGYHHVICGFPAPYDRESMERLATQVRPRLEALIAS